MCKVAVFIPTYRPGGIDVFEASLARQTREPDWIFVADELEREEAWSSVVEYLTISTKMLHPKKSLGDIRNLAKAYNEAAHQCLVEDIDLLISLQDYIWAPPNGIERFVEIYEKSSTSLITGLTHISKDPYPEDIYDLVGDYTIFDEPFRGKPLEIDWHDVRDASIYNNEAPVFEASPEHWEANWAAIPTTVFEKGVRWDTDYDKGIAYENIDFAKQAQKEGYNVLLDTQNVAISLPHKKYWPREEIEIKKYSNRWMHDAKWDN